MVKKVMKDAELVSNIKNDISIGIKKKEILSKYNISSTSYHRIVDSLIDNEMANKVHHNRTNQELENKVCEMFLEGHNCTYIVGNTGLSRCTVNRILKRNNIVDKVQRNMLDITNRDKDKIVNLYNLGFSTVDIEKIFNNKLSERTVAKILRDRNIEIRDFGAKAIVENENFFEKIDNEEKAYWLGFIEADGCLLSKNNNFRLSIALQIRDCYLLEKLYRSIGCYNVIKNFNDLTISYEIKSPYIVKDKTQCILEISSKKIYDDLYKNGICERKTFILEFNKNIRKDLYPHYIRGFFDGDGTVYISNNRLNFGFIGQPIYLKELQYILNKEIGLSVLKINDSLTSNVSKISYSSFDDIISFYNYLYKDATIYLTRKKDKFFNYMMNKNMLIPR